jgi:hypothetical protein
MKAKATEPELIERAVRRADYSEALGAGRRSIEVLSVDASGDRRYVIVYRDGAAIWACRERPNGQLRRISPQKLPSALRVLRM